MLNYTVNKAVGEVNLTLNKTRGNITIEVGSVIALNLSALSGDSGAAGELFRSGVRINGGVLPLGNRTTENALGLINITGYLNDSQNYTGDSESWFISIVDTQNPNITAIQPTNGTTLSYGIDSVVKINATVKDNLAVNIVYANVTFPNGTQSTRRNMTDPNTDSVYNFTLTDLSQLGRYTIRFFANDTSNNINATESMYFFVNDTLPPIIQNLTETPTDPSVYSPTAVYNFTADVVDDIAVNNVTVDWNGTNYTTEVKNIGGNTYRFNRTSLGAGVYTYYWYAFDAAGNRARNGSNTYTIQQAAGEVKLELNTSRSNVTIEVGRQILLNASSVLGDSNPIGNLFREGIVLNFGILPLSNLSIFNTLGVFNITAIQNASQNYTSDVETWFVQTVDLTPPVVKNVSPALSSLFPPYSIINISANVTDNIAVDKVFANVSFPNLSTILMQLSRVGVSDNYTGLFNDTTQAGVYNVTFIANDTSNNINNTGRTNFTTQDTTPPIITNLTEDPPEPVNFTIGKFYQFNATVIDVDGPIDTVRIWFNGTFYNVSNISSLYPFNRTGLSAGFYTYYWIANDTAGNENQTTLQNYTVLRHNTTAQLRLNGTEGNITLEVHTLIDAVGTLLGGTGLMDLLRGSETLNVDDSPITNDTTFDTLGTIQMLVRYNESDNYSASSARWYVTVVDTTNPVVKNITPAQGTSFRNGTVFIDANVTDNYLLDKVKASITFPNGTVKLLSMSSISQDIYEYALTDTDQSGRYNVTILANDTSGNLNATEKTYFSLIGPNEIDVFDLKVLQANSTTRIFEYKAKDIANYSITASWIFNTGADILNSTILTTFAVNETVWYYVQYTYTNASNYTVTAKANTSLSFDQESITITV